MTANYNKNRYLQLLEERKIGNNSNSNELLGYSCQLEQQLDWEIREQYLELMENFLNDSISMPEFFTQLQTKIYSIMDAVRFLENHQILLSLDKRASKFSELMEPIIDELQGELSCTGDEFTDFIEENFIKIKEYLNNK